MKIPKKYSTLLFAVLVGLTMSFFMSFFLTLINIGLAPDFLFRWSKAFFTGFLIALPISIIIIPLIRKVVTKVASD